MRAGSLVFLNLNGAGWVGLEQSFDTYSMFKVVCIANGFKYLDEELVEVLMFKG